MSILNRIFRFVFSWQMLAFLAVVLLACVVWFVGPLLTFGEFHPLASIGMRGTVIVLLLAFFLFWLNGWWLSVIVTAVLCLVIWQAGPLLSIGTLQPLAAEWIRILVIAVILFCYAAWCVYKLLQALDGNKALLERILHPSANKPEAIARDEIRAVGNVISRSVQQLRRMRSSAGGVRRFFEGKRYLYELPWYMVIGTPGAGKTTAILNSGLQFPLAEQMGSASLQGDGGTKNCTWWFTNETVLIDTAGRYTEQDEQQSDDVTKVNAAEWKGFLGLLRKHRPRAPINGALLTVSVADLLSKSASERISISAAMRARLAELRGELGIRFPVYVLVTKLDLLPGFAEYFQSLTTEGRAQVWGFTLPYREETLTGQEGIRRRCQDELRLLEQRLDAGVDSRLMEEYEHERRRQLYALPQEFRSLAAYLAELLEQVFLDSRYDDTQLHTTLRGVYFSSAAQAPEAVVADRLTLFQRLKRGLAGGSDKPASTVPTGNRSYFLNNLFQHLIVPESHLVRPNLRWEFRFRLLRLLSHAIAVVLFVWLVSALMLSFGNNRDYLATISSKTDALAAQVQAWYKAPDPKGIPDLLGSARDLAQYEHLDLDSPGGAWRYGLYTAPDVMDVAQETYGHLESNLLLPQIVRRMEAALAESVNSRNADATYNTLATYLMLFDKQHYDGASVKNWVLQDWQHSESANVFGSRASMVDHLDALFADGKLVQSPFVKNDDLIQQARTFLDGNPTTSRLYQRAKMVMEKDAPEDFTLTRVIGPQAGTIFRMASGTPLDRGIPGIFTYDGYHAVFNKRLPEFVAQAQTDDAWVMGRREVVSTLPDEVQAKKTAAFNASLADDIRRQYLNEYADHWQTFLDDIRSVSSGDDSSGSSLALDLQTLRILAAPDSPLARLAKAAAHETSLTVVTSSDDPSLTDKALSALDKKTRSITKSLGLRPEQKLEKELVDNRFAALREVVTGQADAAQPSTGTPAGAERALQLDAITGLLNEQYTLLVVADNALSSNSMPPAGDVSAKLRIEAAKLPSPFRAVLSEMAIRVADKVNQGMGSLLSTQMEAALGDECRRAIEGKYPFAASTQEVDADDFARLFASGGLLDDFFQKTLASHVDTSSKPWHYKVASPDMPAIHGPDLDAFQRAAAIRDVFFREPGAKRMGWKMDVKFASVDPQITQLALDIDGQGTRYSHGPVVPFTVNWPGPRGGAEAEITANPRVRPETSTIITNGPWALFRLLERGRLIQTASSNRLAVDFNFDGRHAVLDLQTGSLPNPLTTDLLKGFHCPRGNS